VEGRISLGGRGSQATLPDGISQTNAQIARNETLKTTGVTVKEKEGENCLSKARLTSAEGYTSALAQLA
jgi:hypothetical protein